MGDSLITMLAILLVVLLMIIYPLLVMSENNESISQMAATTITAEFVETVTTQGVIQMSDYEGLLHRLHATGNTFDVEIEVRHLDENPSRREVVNELIPGNAPTRNVTYSVFTTTILDRLIEDEGRYILKRGDTVVVTVRNTNRTIAQLLRDSFFSIIGRT
ncbi:MAG: hypothetical protein FWC68_00415, partial [Oscillospiraceae bacterium]|nr:hypothetical protein [Oscillospiraceae bacterium]